jgi:hypothetical protein
MEITPLELKLNALSKAATKFATQTATKIPTFDPNSKPFTWPADKSFPCLRVLEGTLRPNLIPNPLHRAIALRQQHDPDEQSLWVFVPVPDHNEVWLVRTARFDPALN